MKYLITLGCGHEQEVDIIGSAQERARKIAWYEGSGKCEACKKAEKQAAIDDARAEYRLPALTGSEKQVAWAETLRTRFIDDVKELFKAAPMEAAKQGEGGMRIVLAEQTAAKWWIDSRDDSLVNFGQNHVRRDALREAIIRYRGQTVTK